MENIYIFEGMVEMNTQELKNQIIEKAWTDAEFKKQLLTNPKAAIKDVFGVDVPDEINLHVNEEDSNNYYLALPQNPADIKDVEGTDAVRWM